MRRIALALLAVPALLLTGTPAVAAEATVSDVTTFAVAGTARQWVIVRSGPSS
jgi:hypothetical protein